MEEQERRSGPVGTPAPVEGTPIDPGTGEPLREEDVTRADRLDDRVEEGDGLPEDGESE